MWEAGGQARTHSVFSFSCSYENHTILIDCGPTNDRVCDNATSPETGKALPCTTGQGSLLGSGVRSLTQGVIPVYRLL